VGPEGLDYGLSKNESALPTYPVHMPPASFANGRLSLTETLRERQREANAMGDLGFPERQPNGGVRDSCRSFNKGRLGGVWLVAFKQ
jgi:hypothetical protein